MGGISEVRGTSNADLLMGGGQGRTTDGSGFEFFTGLAGNDTINGVGGFDFAVYVQSINGIEVDMRKTSEQVQDGYVWTDPLTNMETRYFDTLIGIENIQGSQFDDTVQGGSSEFYFNGRRGADRVTAGSGYMEVQYDQDPAAINVMLGGWVGVAGSTIPNGFSGSARDGWGDIDLLQGVTGWRVRLLPTRLSVAVATMSWMAVQATTPLTVVWATTGPNTTRRAQAFRLTWFRAERSTMDKGAWTFC